MELDEGFDDDMGSLSPPSDIELSPPGSPVAAPAAPSLEGGGMVQAPVLSLDLGVKRKDDPGGPAGLSGAAKRSRTDQAPSGGHRVERDVDTLTKGGMQSWTRPSVPIDFKPTTWNLTFQAVDADYYSASTLMSHIPNGFDRHSNKTAAVIRMYGTTEYGNSVTAHIHGFLPYFYVPCWPNFVKDDTSVFSQALNEALCADSRYKAYSQCVLGVDLVDRQSIWGYNPQGSSKFMKVRVAFPPMVASARRLLEKGIEMGSEGTRCFATYESNLPFVLRFMVDREIQGGAWLELPRGSYHLRFEKQKSSRAQIEVDVMWNQIVAHQPVGEWLKMAPLRILSFDIECASRRNAFPEPGLDPVIQIANVVHVWGEDTPLAKNVFCLNTCASIHGAQVLAHKTEEELLKNWKEFLVTIDPDLITGYNIINFDLPYLLNRAQALKLESFPFLGRLINSKTTMKDSTFSSKAYGTSTNKDISIEGRVQFDLLLVIRREYKLRSYTLNSVCAHFLGQQKEDVHYSIISDLQNGDANTRHRLAVYCLKDACLPMLLLEKLLLATNYIEMARVTGVPVSFILTRGQQIKVVSQLFRKAREHGLVVPVREKHVTEDKYEGATVIEPLKGHYEEPIATLDFASLYPSIMMAHNLCYTTLISSKVAETMDPSQYLKTPNGDYFVKSHVRKGLLPEILQELLDARAVAKKDMATAKDPLLRNVLNGRQLALKISANSVYGFTGAQVGQLPCLEISSSVTAFGRQMIIDTKERVEAKYTIANGFSHDARVIYGDTDSVMVRFGTKDMAECMELGRQAAEYVSQFFEKPIRLEFEKVYCPYLLMNKKRYAGLYWTRPDKWDKLDAKGIESVRRDNCALVANLVNKCLKMILIDRDVHGAEQYAKNMIADLLQQKIDLSELVISKALTRGGAEDYTAKQAHVELAERMRKRDPRTAPKIGDRVPYVIVKAAKGAKAYEKSEDPIYVLENDVPIDTDYYLHNQLEQPLTRIFEPILGDKVTSLFLGEHTRKIKVSTPTVQQGVSSIMRFAVKQRVCMGCKIPLKEGESVVCSHCLSQQAALYVERIDEMREHEKVFNMLWSQCQRCQGSLHQDVLCTSRDCPIFYRRRKVQKDLKETQRALDRFAF